MKEEQFEKAQTQSGSGPSENKDLTLASKQIHGLDNDEFIRRTYSGKLPPGTQVNTFCNTEHLFPTRRITRGINTRPLTHSKRPLEDILFQSNGNEYDLFDYISGNRLTGLLVLKNSEITLESYELGNTEKTCWMSMSMAKSISTTLVGIAIQQGYIKSVEEPLASYISELTGSAYEKVTIKQLLQMTSGAKWNEDHTNPNSERREVLELQIAQQPGTILNYMTQLPQVAKPGETWNYSTGETQVVGALIHSATGKYLADYLSETIWSKVGMESDAHWWLESPDGLEVAGSGISATLRDYGRFGLFMMNDGIVNGERLLPIGWVKEAGTPFIVNNELVPYGYMWWAVPDKQNSFSNEAFCARGIFGQRIYINPTEKVVIVVWSARSKPMGSEVIVDNDFFNAVVEVLHRD